MSDDNLDLLQALGSLAREQEQEHEHLEALCNASSTPLRAATREARATTPLSTDMQAQIAKQVRDALGSERRAPLQLVAREPSEARQARRFNVFKLTGLLLPLAAAAAAALLFRSTGQPIAPLPEYNLQAQGSLEYRAEPAGAEPLRVAKGSALRIELRPNTHNEGPLDLRVQLQHEGHSIEWPAQIERSPHGSLRLTLARADVDVEGSAELRIVLARPEVLAELGYRDTQGPRGEGWQAWRVPVDLP
jgi:hypothetical protein